MHAANKLIGAKTFQASPLGADDVGSIPGIVTTSCFKNDRLGSFQQIKLNHLENEESGFESRQQIGHCCGVMAALKMRTC